MMDSLGHGLSAVEKEAWSCVIRVCRTWLNPTVINLARLSPRSQRGTGLLHNVRHTCSIPIHGINAEQNSSGIPLPNSSLSTFQAKDMA